MKKYGPIVNIKGNVVQTSAILLSATENQKKATSEYFPKIGYGEGIPSRKWTTTEKIMAALLAASVVAYGGHEVAKKYKKKQ